MRWMCLFALLWPPLVVAAPLFSPTCRGSPAFPLSANSPQWNGWSPDVTNARFQAARAAGIAPSAVPQLKLKWAFNPGEVKVARSQPTIIAGRLFIGTQTGALYALDIDTGCTRWGFQARAPIRSGVSFGDARDACDIFRRCASQHVRSQRRNRPIDLDGAACGAARGRRHRYAAIL
jgi:glucose dehydrogenase